ncbi:hypothetical protein [Neisseria perflava]|uniref:hypothetical protein n=1 Tax=Neisseria perflava TaxID=33053 RepID=UPI0020A09653|nr:hypothetical protein [Neisseria perflava]MCP1660093.1 Flp pilus assembly protein TadB [Neisseria perflava]MCP1772773.1 Flp pilus assembly protein TadB [Neisseria perflava]
MIAALIGMIISVAVAVVSIFSFWFFLAVVIVLAIWLSAWPWALVFQILGFALCGLWLLSILLQRNHKKDSYDINMESGNDWVHALDEKMQNLNERLGLPHKLTKGQSVAGISFIIFLLVLNFLLDYYPNHWAGKAAAMCLAFIILPLTVGLGIWLLWRIVKLVIMRYRKS